ncbi:MAG: enoyl-CoA hydratase/isomerase family protein [bacterium]
MYRTLILEEQEGIFTLTLNQPESRNALSYEMAQEFQRAIGEVARKEHARGLILTGAGPAFCAGGDYHSIISEFSKPAVELQPRLREFYSRFLGLVHLRIPTLAAVNGPAVGAGFSLALACDMRLASKDATFHANFVKIGVHPGMGATYFLPRLLGTSRALEILWAGKPLSAKQALALGIVSRLVEPGRLLSEAMSLLKEITAASSVVLELTKRSVYMGVENSLEDMLERESHAQALCGETIQMKEFLGRIKRMGGSTGNS